MSRASVVAYVTGHGFGHAARMAEVLRALQRERPQLRLHVRSTAPPWLFRGLRPESLTVTPVATDVGVAQTDGLRFRVRDTLDALGRFAAALPALARHERAFLERTRPAAVLSDVSPFPLSWAAALSLPAIAIGNFGWDDIYRAFAARSPGFHPFADLFAGAARDATLLLRLPFAMPMPAFPRVVDVPLLVRETAADPARVRAALAPGRRPVVFLSFGGFGARDLPLDRLARLRRFLFVVGGTSTGAPRPNVRVLPQGELDHVALVRAADVVLGKPGYGLVSEVTAYETRMVYTSRGPFPEYPVLVRALRATGQAVFCSRADLARGDIGSHLERALQRPPRSRRPRARDGAQAVARLVAAHLALS